MATAGEQLTSGPTVEGIICYVIDSGKQVVNIPSLPGGEKSTHIGEYEDKTVSIANARALVPNLSLDREGFALVSHETTVADFYDPDQITTVYNPEIEALIKREMGAKDVVVFDHTLRAGDETIRKTKNRSNISVGCG